MDPTSIETEHQGVQVTYTYQLWQIKKPSVCARFQQDIAVYAPCTVAAQSLFSEACQHFKPLQAKDYAHKKAAAMYCEAANTYQPTIARIEAPDANAGLEEARAACNAAVAGMIGRNDGQLKASKEKACSHYHVLRDAEKKSARVKPANTSLPLTGLSR